MFFLLFLFWVILNGKVTVEIAVTGAAISAAVTWCARLIAPSSPRTTLRAARLVPGVFLYALCLVWQVVLSNLRVMALILRPGRGRPKLVWFTSPVKRAAARLALANSITLTPGTVTVALGEDTICVYALRPELGEGLKENSLTRRLRGLEGEDHE